MRTLLFSLALLAAVSSCKKDKLKNEKDFPPITQEGKNTFGCMFGNTVWVPVKGFSFTSSLSTSYTDNNISINCTRKSLNVTSHLETLVLYFREIVKPGNYSLDSVNTYIRAIVLQPDSSTKYYYINKGSLTVSRLDTANRIVSGVFEAELFLKENKTELVNITSGRFDYTY